MAFEKEKLAQAAALWSSENVQLRAMLAEVEKEIERALVSDAPGEVLENLLFKVQVVNHKTNRA